MYFFVFLKLHILFCGWNLAVPASAENRRIWHADNGALAVNKESAREDSLMVDFPVAPNAVLENMQQALRQVTAVAQQQQDSQQVESMMYCLDSRGPPSLCLRSSLDTTARPSLTCFQMAGGHHKA